MKEYNKKGRKLYGVIGKCSGERNIMMFICHVY
jgi:hypothetical protein